MSEGTPLHTIAPWSGLEEASPSQIQEIQKFARRQDLMYALTPDCATVSRAVLSFIHMQLCRKRENGYSPSKLCALVSRAHYHFNNVDDNCWQLNKDTKLRKKKKKPSSPTFLFRASLHVLFILLLPTREKLTIFTSNIYKSMFLITSCSPIMKVKTK
jgi:hypothetical protein